jgi:hypothetical protein
MSRIKIDAIWNTKPSLNVVFRMDPLIWEDHHNKQSAKEGVRPQPYLYSMSYRTKNSETPMQELQLLKKHLKILLQWSELSSLAYVNHDGYIHIWWRRCRLRVNKPRLRIFDGLMVYFWWNIWKEMNRRIFQNSKKDRLVVVYLIKVDNLQYNVAYLVFV